MLEDSYDLKDPLGQLAHRANALRLALEASELRDDVRLILMEHLSTTEEVLRAAHRQANHSPTNTPASRPRGGMNAEPGSVYENEAYFQHQVDSCNSALQRLTRLTPRPDEAIEALLYAKHVAEQRLQDVRAQPDPPRHAP